MAECRPWAAGLARLLRERGDLQKGELAGYCAPKQAGGVPFRPGTISVVAKSSRMPDIHTLQRIADGFTAYDRRVNGGDPAAPTVNLWEFFVTDEQASLLRNACAAQRALVSQQDLIKQAVADLAPVMEQAIRSHLSATPRGGAHESVNSSPSSTTEESLATGTHTPVARGAFPRRKKR